MPFVNIQSFEVQLVYRHIGLDFSTENNLFRFICRLFKTNPKSKTHKIYFDYGDQTLDALYKPLQLKVDLVMKEKGFTSKNWMTKYFQAKIILRNLKERLNIPLEFLLKIKP
jgi:hypothetical protein